MLNAWRGMRRAAEAGGGSGRRPGAGISEIGPVLREEQASSLGGEGWGRRVEQGERFS